MAKKKFRLYFQLVLDSVCYVITFGFQMQLFAQIG